MVSDPNSYQAMAAQPVRINSESIGSSHLVKPLTSQGGGSMKSKLLMGFLTLFIIIAGIGSGYILSAFKNAGGLSGVTLKRSVSKEEITKGTQVGVADTKTFKDSAEGTLEKGGVGGEGSHHLVRPGGDSQNVYLTSSIIDLDQFTGKKVKVWGETFSAQKAGWLMDVGKLEVLE
ncbi:hypothetical protein A2160_03360 [Candidatus Beckwithbacteria bacterium RBG_13_42_9]|uniref:Uncharacterized protein n=1 Tax=Candidatus Beckwithbacteria bacterium RBG_13_42_9 TaxID=1797457 RepID=A0A1F5E8I1_9BACT|nr:MAG: hypothetical protein A2160_03360 [Candidatus Beckwithbacteria bacterium RBG_13_42_9]